MYAQNKYFINSKNLSTHIFLGLVFLLESIKKMLEGKYVKLRPLELEDLDVLKKWRNSKFIRIATREYRLLNMINQKHWFESIHKDNPPKYIMFGILNSKNNLIGVCGLTYIDWKNRHAEVSIYIGKNNWQKLKEAKDNLQVLINYGFGELNLHRLWAEIYETAPNNVILFEQMKFKKEGKLRDQLWRNGKWHNSFLYAKLSKE